MVKVTRPPGVTSFSTLRSWLSNSSVAMSWLLSSMVIFSPAGTVTVAGVNTWFLRLIITGGEAARVGPPSGGSRGE